jgi:uncharacterized protein
MPAITPTASGVRIAVQVQPRASKTEMVGLHGEAIRIRVAAPPVDGAANDALLRFLAELLGMPRAAVSLSRGASGRRKTVMVAGLTVTDATRLLKVGGG